MICSRCQKEFENDERQIRVIMTYGDTDVAFCSMECFKKYHHLREYLLEPYMNTLTNVFFDIVAFTVTRVNY